MPNTRTRVFDRITVDHMIRGVTRVSWRLYYSFSAPAPYSFQLQVGRTGLPAADDWEDVGPPATDSVYAVDDTVRLSGASLLTHYRVILTDADGTAYPSNPAAAYGILPLRDWLLAAEIVRKDRLLHRSFIGIPGWLLKRKRVGQVPVAAKYADTLVDPLTGMIVRTQGAGTEVTAGTGIVGGYFAPFRLDVDMPGGGSAAEAGGEQGTYDAAIDFPGCRFLMLPYVDREDLFVADGSDRRYEIGAVAVSKSHRGVPLFGEATFSLLPASDTAYTIEVPETP